ncbi:hypothetical protein HZB01_05095 [Candidatus Woesearchaeota archaeon]|nr:hypothetical protein [Candidatus Woesearchaeota archaeon]
MKVLPVLCIIFLISAVAVFADATCTTPPATRSLTTTALANSQLVQSSIYSYAGGSLVQESSSSLPGFLSLFPEVVDGKITFTNFNLMADAFSILYSGGTYTKEASQYIPFLSPSGLVLPLVAGQNSVDGTKRVWSEYHKNLLGISYADVYFSDGTTTQKLTGSEQGVYNLFPQIQGNFIVWTKLTVDDMALGPTPTTENYISQSSAVPVIHTISLGQAQQLRTPVKGVFHLFNSLNGNMLAFNSFKFSSSPGTTLASSAIWLVDLTNPASLQVISVDEPNTVHAFPAVISPHQVAWNRITIPGQNQPPQQSDIVIFDIRGIPAPFSIKPSPGEFHMFPKALSGGGVVWTRFRLKDPAGFISASNPLASQIYYYTPSDGMKAVDTLTDNVLELFPEESGGKIYFTKATLDFTSTTTDLFPEGGDESTFRGYIASRYYFWKHFVTTIKPFGSVALSFDAGSFPYWSTQLASYTMGTAQTQSTTLSGINPSCGVFYKAEGTGVNSGELLVTTIDASSSCNPLATTTRDVCCQPSEYVDGNGQCSSCQTGCPYGGACYAQGQTTDTEDASADLETCQTSGRYKAMADADENQNICTSGTWIGNSNTCDLWERWTTTETSVGRDDCNDADSGIVSQNNYCCGDDPNEYYVTTTANSQSACCALPADYSVVYNNACYYYTVPVRLRDESQAEGCLNNDCCGDGQDNDGDGKVDNADPDCDPVDGFLDTCYVSDQGCDTDAFLFKVSSNINAHAESPNIAAGQSTEDYSLCCKVSGMENSCTDPTSAQILKLSSSKNAQVGEPDKVPANYNSQVCMSYNSAYSATKVQCGYVTGSEPCSTLNRSAFCVARISDETNAHIQQCYPDGTTLQGASLYPIKVCCWSDFNRCIDAGTGQRDSDISGYCCEQDSSQPIYNWTKEGETDPFAGYGNLKGYEIDASQRNINVRTGNVLECCGDDISENTKVHACGSAIAGPGPRLQPGDWGCS